MLPASAAITRTNAENTHYEVFFEIQEGTFTPEFPGEGQATVEVVGGSFKLTEAA